MTSVKQIFAGLFKILSLKSKRDAFTLIWMLFIGVLAWHHCISDMGVAALATPIVAKIFTDHKEKLQQLTIQTTSNDIPPKGQF